MPILLKLAFESTEIDKMSAIPEPNFIDFISEFHYNHRIIDNLKCFLLEIFLSETAARALLMIRVRTSRDPRNAPIQKTTSKFTDHVYVRRFSTKNHKKWINPQILESTRQCDVGGRRRSQVQSCILGAARSKVSIIKSLITCSAALIH